MNWMKFLAACILLLFQSSMLFSQQWKQYGDSAKVYLDQKNIDKALPYYSKLQSAGFTDTTYINTFTQLSRSLANLYYSARQYGYATLTCNKLMNAINEKRSAFNGDYAWACNMLGVIYNTNGKLDSAKIYHLQAKEIREKLFGINDPSFAQSCNNLGALYRDLGQYELAEPLLLKAKEIREKLPPAKQNDPFAITSVGLANLYRDMGQYEKAELFYLQAKERRALPGKNNWDYASSCNILADLYAYMHEYGKAEALYLEAKDIRGELDSESYDYAQTCNNLSSLYRDIGQLKKAEPLAFEAKKIYDSLPEDHPSHAINLNNLGDLFFAMKDYRSALSYYMQARKLWSMQLGKDHPYYALNSANLARIYWNLNDESKANALYAEALAGQRNQVDKVFRFTSEKEKQLFIQNASASADEYLSFYFQEFATQSAGLPYTISLSNRNLILSSSQQVRQTIFNSKDTLVRGKYNSWISLKEQLAALYSREGSWNNSQVKEAEEQAGAMEKDLSVHSAAFKNAQKKTTWQNIQPALKANEASIEFVEFRFYNGNRWTDSTYYIALVLRKDNPSPQMVTLFEKKQLDDLLSKVNKDDDINLLYSGETGSKVFNLIWKPLKSYLKGTNKVYFAPAGNLFKISFAALSTGNNKVLSDRYQLVQLNTTASVADNKQPLLLSATDHIQLYGGIRYDVDSNALKQVVHNVERGRHSSIKSAIRGGSFQFLPGTLDEVASIKLQAEKRSVPVSILSGVNATEESFKALAGVHSPSVLHVATHGFFFQDPKYDTRDSILKKLEKSGKVFRQSENPLLRSGLLFAGANNAWKGNYFSGVDDGILTAYEAANMYLPNTKLVILSACETALGDVEGSEGVYGLQRGFKMAGVKNLVMSLWKVPDVETSAFMQLFYRNLFNKQPVIDAFSHAQNAMKLKYRGEPNKWAAWVLIN
jgi:CHAT domain-containing protein